MKKRIAFVLAVCLFAAMTCSPFFAYAFVKTESAEVPLLQEGDYELLSEPEIAYATNTRGTSVEDFMYQQLLNANSQISVQGYNVKKEDAAALFANVVNDHPDLFYVSSNIQYAFSGNTVFYFVPQYALNTAEIAQAKQIFNAGKNRALACVDASMNDMQKALTLHDYICNYAIYPATIGPTIYHSAYGFFLNHTVVCAGYSLTYSYLLREAGIESEYVSSDAMTHAWNKVKIDNQWYNVDVTFDDGDYDKGKNTYGSVGHACFMKSDAYFSTKDGSFHYGGVTYDACNANSTTYDNYFWNDVRTRIYTLNGDYYYLKPTGTYSANLIKRTLAGNESNVGASFTAVSGSGYSIAVDQNGNQHQVPYSALFAQLTCLDNRFYVSGYNALYSITATGTQKKILDFNGYPIGLSDLPNGNLVYMLHGATEAIELDKLSYYNDYLATAKTSAYHNFPDVNNDGIVNAKDYALIKKQRANA